MGQPPAGTVTLLFTDLVRSTELLDALGDDEAERLSQAHFRLLREAVVAGRGQEVKTIGDAVMAAFADPADGVRAALAIQQNLAALNAAPGDEPLVIKIGLHAGPCIAVTLNDRLDYFGATVNMAARLQGESVGGDIVFSEAVLADPIVSTMLRPGDLSSETRSIKGFSRPITFCRLSGKTQAAD